MTTAFDVAADFFALNRPLVAEVQPWLELNDPPPGWALATGRDGSPTLRQACGGGVGAWWKGCSVPRAASLAMLESFEPSSTVACFLHPMHPAAVLVALEMLGPRQALIVLLGPGEQLPLWLMPLDFRRPLQEHRLFFARHPDDIRTLLSRHEGLPLPGQFIRTPAIDDETCRQVIEQCQSVFAEVHHARHAVLHTLHTRPASRTRPPRRAIVGQPAGFRLWDDAADTLRQVVCSLDGLHVQPWPFEDPLHTAPLDLARRTEGADVVLLADLFRADLGGQLPPTCPLVTWTTQPRPVSWPTGGDDWALAATSAARSALLQSGWPAERVLDADWPSLPVAPPPLAVRTVGLLADTQPVRLPPAVEEYSSHRLLWEHAEAAIRTDPAVVGEDAIAYVEQLRAALSIDPAAFPLDLFVQRLVIPAWQHSVARHLVAGGFRVHIHGHGWDRLGELSEQLHPAWRGPLDTADALVRAAGPLTHLVRPMPLPGNDPLRRLGRPVLQVLGNWQSRPSVAPPQKPGRPLSPALLGELLRRI
ncbi:MAG: hypothetical protein ACK4PI_03320 [Tepidisphaerales bacterium]